MEGCWTIASPARGPVPYTTLQTPAGRPRVEKRGVCVCVCVCVCRGVSRRSSESRPAKIGAKAFTSLGPQYFS